MKTKIIKTILYLVLVVLSISFAHANNLTINDLIGSFNYSYSNGSIDVITKGDHMLDKNSNGLNDTLVINLTNSIAGDGTFKFLITLLDKENIFVNTTSKLVTSSDPSVQVNFPTAMLSSSKFNYTIEILDMSNELVYREYRTQTNVYSKYETGTNITRIWDGTVNNDFLRINLTLNSTQASTLNVTVNLNYNSSTISRTEEKTLSVGIQNISVSFDNETIKSTHYYGNFTISSIIIGSKIFQPNRNTSIYNYEDFARTSYIRTIKDTRIDTNANNLSESLEINFTVIVKTQEVYNLTYDLYDEFNNYVATVNKTANLVPGNHTIQTRVNGSDIYKAKINGPYLISLVKITVGNATKDSIFNAHTTNRTFYADYERPPLPDLNISMTSSFDSTTNSTNITINLSNLGPVSAFGVFLDIFDNKTFQDNKSSAILEPGRYLFYEFNITNSSNSTLITAIADFDNLVDESDESNNIVQSIETSSSSVPTAIDVKNLFVLHSNQTVRLFEFSINNTLSTTLTNVTWSLDTKNSYVVNGTNFSLQSGQRSWVFIDYNFIKGTGPENFNVNATVRNNSISDSENLTITVI